MASPNVYSGGLNLTGTVFENGPAVLQLMPAYLSGAVQWLDTISGNNANAGTDPELPVATMAQAVTNSAANGVIVIGEGSAQAPAASQTINLAGLTIVGCGSGTSRPRFTNGVTGNQLWAITAAGVRVRNIYFPASTGGPAGPRLNVTAANVAVRDCYFECGTGDAVSTGSVLIGAGANSANIRATTFAVTGSRPDIGLAVTSAVTDLTVEDTTFDGGSFGWADFAFKISAAATRIQLENVALLRRSDFSTTVTATSYQAFGLTADGLNRVVWTA